MTAIEQALAIAVAENNQFEIAFCHLMAAYVMIYMQRYNEAVPVLETSQALFDARNEPYYVCWVLHRLGCVYFNLNAMSKAHEYTEQSLALARTTYNRVALVICFYNLGSNSIVAGNYVKGAYYSAEALQVATDGGHQDQIAHALSLLALCAFCQGDYATCQEYAERSRGIIEDINPLVFEPYNLSLLILLACLREAYAEGVQLSSSGIHDSTNKMGLQLTYWALATLSCGLGHPTEAREQIQKLLQLSKLDEHTVLPLWIAPSMAYTLTETDPEKAVELLAWISSYPDPSLTWARDWRLLDRLETELQAAMDRDTYRIHWHHGEALSVDAVATLLQQEFGTASKVAATQHTILSPREHDILRLMATGLTNPQIASELMIGAGTVKTYTLNIYRKLEVANRTQAIVRAQELALLNL